MMMAADGPDPEREQRKRALLIFIFILILFILLVIRLIHIQISSGALLTRQAEEQQRSRSLMPARRGMILDRMHRIVAASRQRPDVYVDPMLIEGIPQLAVDVGIRLDMEPGFVEELIRRRENTRFVVIAERVDEVEAQAIRQLDHPAVGLLDRSVRSYPLGESLAHVLGFVGKDGTGLEGIELVYDEHMTGRDGFAATIRDAKRQALLRAEVAGRPPLDGGHAVLTIDAEIQRYAEEALAASVGEFEAKSGVAIVMDPRTGEVLAMACFPSYDVNFASKVDKSLRRNRCVTDPVEPGSTFKPFVASGALTKGHITPTESFDCHMGHYFAGRRLIRDTSPHGMMTIKEIICKSSNIGMALIGQRMGAESLHETMTRFGFGRLTGVGFPGEAKGLLHPLEKWNSYSVTSVPMGYEIGVTPLQLITAFCAIANGGSLLKPKIMKELLGPGGEVVIAETPPEPVKRVLSKEWAKYLRETVMVSVVEDGSGHRCQIEGYQVFGKTGTTKLAYKDRRGYEPGAYLSSFVAGVPAQNPRLAALVMIRRPNAVLGYYGGKVSAPAVKEILSRSLEYLQVQKNK